MKSLSMSEVNQIGINLLTGEADAYCMGRILCDLNEHGVALVREYFGMAVALDPKVQFPANWNGMVGDEPSVASVMLTRETINHLIQFSLFREGYEYVVVHTYGYVGLNRDDEYYQGYVDLCASRGSHNMIRNPSFTSGAPSEGGRNTHIFSGRTV